MTQPSQILRNILRRIKELSLKNQHSLAVFDLDSTLFDVSPRLQRILRDFSEDKEFQKRFPDSCHLLKSAETLRTDWGIKDALIRAGLDGHHPDFHHDLKEFWLKNFFSNHYLEYDLPYEGAQEYISSVYENGAHVAYLTGRDIARMGEGTLKVLKKWNFPIGSPRTSLILKPEAGMDDAQFKTDYFSNLPAAHYQNIWFFENEPVNTNLVGQDHGHIDIVFFDSTHSGKAEPHPDLPKIVHYLLEKED